MKRYQLGALSVLSLVSLWGVEKSALGAEGNPPSRGMGIVNTKILESFETPDSWEVHFSNFRCRNWEGTINPYSPENSKPTDVINTPKQPESTQADTAQPADPDDSATWIKTVNLADFSPADQGFVQSQYIRPEDMENEKAFLAVKGCWDRAGRNTLYISPKNQIITPDNPVSISVLAWGMGYKYDLFAIFTDGVGQSHRLYLGNLGFFGWEAMEANIPPSFYSTDPINPSNRLTLSRIEVVGSAESPAKSFYLYLDYMLVRYSDFQYRFDGKALQDNRW